MKLRVKFLKSKSFFNFLTYFTFLDQNLKELLIVLSATQEVQLNQGFAQSLLEGLVVFGQKR